MTAPNTPKPEASNDGGGLKDPIDCLNFDAISSEEVTAYEDNLFSDLFTADDGLPADIKQTVREKLLPCYVRASLVAKENQRTYRTAGLLTYSLSALAVGAVAVGTLVHSLSTVAFALELLFLLVILVTIIRANHKRAHTKWMHARYIAERTRAAIFLTVCGVETSQVLPVTTIARQSNSDEWMLTAYNQISAGLPLLTTCHGEAADKFVSFVRREWLAEQIAFHKRVAHEAERKNVWLERIGMALFCAAVIAAATHLLLSALHLELLEHPLTFAAIFLPAAGAAVGGIRTHREYSRLAVRSRNMADGLRALDSELATVESPEELARVLKRIEELTLIELQDWLLLMSVAKLEAAA